MQSKLEKLQFFKPRHLPFPDFLKPVLSSFVFLRIYSYCFPMMITVLRYLFVVHSMKVKCFGMARVVNFVILLSILLPILMTISFQYPLSDYIHWSYNNCIGRFEVYFNPDAHNEGNFFEMFNFKTTEQKLIKDKSLFSHVSIIGFCWYSCTLNCCFIEVVGYLRK